MIWGTTFQVSVAVIGPNLSCNAAGQRKVQNDIRISNVGFLCTWSFVKFIPTKTELEIFSQAYSRASSLSYTAGVADFDAVNNFSKDEAKEARNENSNLEQTKRAIEECKLCLDRIVSMIQRNQ